MASQANLVLQDAQATPVNHTFVAAGVDGKGVGLWLEKTTSSIAAGFFRLTQSTRVSSKPGEPNRHTLKLVVPTVVVETINGVNYNKVARQGLITVDVVCPADSTAAERADLLAYAGNSLLGFSTANTLGGQVYNQEPVV